MAAARSPCWLAQLATRSSPVDIDAPRSNLKDLDEIRVYIQITASLCTDRSRIDRQAFEAILRPVLQPESILQDTDTESCRSPVCTKTRSCDFKAHLCKGIIHENYKLFVNPLRNRAASSILLLGQRAALRHRRWRSAAKLRGGAARRGAVTRL